MKIYPLINIWVVSDLHFLHDNLIKEEYCSRPENHSEKIFEYLMQIPKKDILVCLGDISIGKELEVYDTFIKPIKCKKILVKGNHDRKSNNWYLNHGWDFVCYSFQDTYRKKKILFSHYPKCADDYDLNIHGHLHNNIYKWEKLNEENKSFVNDKHLLISMELMDYKPKTISYIIENIDKFRLLNTFKKDK